MRLKGCEQGARWVWNRVIVVDWNTVTYGLRMSHSINEWVYRIYHGASKVNIRQYDHWREGVSRVQVI